MDVLLLFGLLEVRLVSGGLALGALAVSGQQLRDYHSTLE